jgi:hypothetical protein
MRGIGRIYEAYRDGILEDDDEVAVLHGPEELGYPPVTEAMVNVRATLTEATRCSILAPDLATRLIDLAKSHFYKERTYEALLHAATAPGLPAIALRDFAIWLPSGRLDQKRLDAEAMLDAICAHLRAGVPPLRVTYELAETVAWDTVRRTT